MAVPLLSILAALSAAFHLRAIRTGDRVGVYVSKPLTIAALMALAYVAAPGVPGSYRAAILVGLALSLVGDVFLMVPGDRFLEGLTAFFLAHVAYVAAFAERLESMTVLPYLPYLVATLFLLTLIWRRLDRMKGPVLAYTLVITAMAGTALAVATETGGISAWTAAAGAAVFTISDAALAIDRFVGPLPRGKELIMGTYFAAQWAIAFSVLA
jgi:uncharacterized membrane protein YhhN